MSELSHPSRVTDIPPPSPELVLLRVFAEAYLCTAHEKPKRRARAFLKVVADLLATEESVSLAFPIRPSQDMEKVALARRQAVGIFRQYAPLFVARLPREDT